MGTPPTMVDILSDLIGVGFDQAWLRRADVIVEPHEGLTAWFMSREDLITAKLAAGRPQDYADIAALRAASPKRDLIE